MKSIMRKALLGGVALTVMAAGAHADDVDELKAQIEALQARVNNIEMKGAALPEGVSLITFNRGRNPITFKSEGVSRLGDAIAASRGMTIAITPTADLPAPATEITISGYVRAVGVWGKAKVKEIDHRLVDVDAGTGTDTDNTDNSTAWETSGTCDDSNDTSAAECAKATRTSKASDKDFDMVARGHLNIKSKTDTAVGQVRTNIEARLEFGKIRIGEKALGYTHNDDDPGVLREIDVRKAYGEWDFMPNWTFLAGHTGQIAAISNVGYATIPSPYGVDSSRRTQVRLMYSGGPLQFGFGMEDPSTDDVNGLNTTTIPDFAGYVQFNAPMGMSLRVTGEMGKVGVSANNTKTGYLVGVGAAANISMVKASAAFVYTKGLGCDSILSTANSGAASCVKWDNSLVKGYGIQGNLGMDLTETVSFNVAGGYYKLTNLDDVTYTGLGTGTATIAIRDANTYEKGWSIGGNMIWKPVDALQFALEADYHKAKQVDGGSKSTFLAGAAVWFYF